jgi:hypothetical protein
VEAEVVTLVDADVMMLVVLLMVLLLVVYRLAHPERQLSVGKELV